MTVRALFFASYRDLVGAEELDIELPGPATAGDLVRALRRPGAAGESLPESPVVAVNMTYAPLSAALNDGDEVAFIPPVAGG